MKTLTLQAHIEQAQTQAEKAQKCLSLIDKTIEKLAEQLEQGYSDVMKHYIKAMSRFHHYSINNLFLIMAQKPEATHVAGFRTWMNFNRQVKKGEKGIRIFAPVMVRKKTDEDEQFSLSENVNLKRDDERILFFRTVCVFDISQTEGAELPETLQVQGDATALIPKIEQAIKNTSIEIEYGDTGSALGISLKGKIMIKPNMSSAETFSTLVHEFAHEILHQSGESKESKTIRELEADAIACVVCEHYGIHALAASADYIQLWNGDKNQLLGNMERIRIGSSKIIELMNNASDHP